MSERKKIRQYLDNLQRYLTPLDTFEAQEVIREIESHIYDVIDEIEMKGETADVDEILTRLGPPHALGQQYVGHIQHGDPPPEGFKALTLMKKGLSRSVYYGLMCFGYTFGMGLIALAFANLIIPNGIAIWTEANGNSVVIGMLDNPIIAEQAKGVFQSFWITPIALVTGYLLLLITHKILKFISPFSKGIHHG